VRVYLAGHDAGVAKSRKRDKDEVWPAVAAAAGPGAGTRASTPPSWSGRPAGGAGEAGAKYAVTDCLGRGVRDGGELPLPLERHLMPKRTGRAVPGRPTRRAMKAD
jgi:hypothetical protein